MRRQDVTMIDIYPIILFLATGILWFFTALQGRRLLRSFRERYPQIAQREIPYAFDKQRHPEKALFFYRRKAGEILREDTALSRSRRRFIQLSLFSVLVPALGFLSLAIFTVIMSRQ